MRTVRLALAMTVAVGCAVDEPAAPGGPQVAILQLSIGNQIVEIDRNGSMIGGPIAIRAQIDVPIEATFLRQDRTPATAVTAAQYQLNVVPVSGAAALVFTRSTTNSFNGVLRSNVPDSNGSLRLSLFHVEEQKDYWGPFTVAVLVTN